MADWVVWSDDGAAKEEHSLETPEKSQPLLDALDSIKVPGRPPNADEQPRALKTKVNAREVRKMQVTELTISVTPSWNIQYLSGSAVGVGHVAYQRSAQWRVGRHKSAPIRLPASLRHSLFAIGEFERSPVSASRF